MIDVNGTGYQGAMLVYQMLNDLSRELGYEGANDLVGEERCVNVELLQIVQERLIAQVELRRQAAMDALRQAELDVQRAYQ